MLARKMDQYLRKWRITKGSECLLIKGARQVGKTYAVRRFGEREYQSYLEVNFIEHPEFSTVFAESLDAADINRRLSLLVPKASFPAHRTLLFLDEIQECPQSRTALKFLAQDPAIDVVASGSLLGMEHKDASRMSVPVGYERQVEMFPLDMEEFLWAMGYEPEALLPLHEAAASASPLPQAVHGRFLRLMREYMAVGGMPAVVQRFVDTANFYEAYAEQRKILDSHNDDIAKYAPASIRAKARACYDSMPRQLAKENTKFRYGVVEKKGTARKFDTAVDWLEEASLVHRCACVSTPQFPLKAYERAGRFRLYLSDTGLLTAQYGFEMMAAVVEDKLAGPMKGGYYENLAACMLACAGQPLHYWKNDRGDCEIEFLIERNAAVRPIEVKAKRGATASLNHMLESDAVEMGYKLGSMNAGIEGKKVALPLYLGMFLIRAAGEGCRQGA